MVKPVKQALADNAPWRPSGYSDADAFAIQALSKGEADSDQQKRALKWIIERASESYNMSYRPGDTHDTAFAEGKRFIGSQIIKLIKVKIGQLKK